MYDRIIGPTLTNKEETLPSYAEGASKARKNAGLDTHDQGEGVIGQEDGVIVINDDDDNGVVQGVFLKEDPVNRFSVIGRYTFPGQEMVHLDESNELSNKGETLGNDKQ